MRVLRALIGSLGLLEAGTMAWQLARGGEAFGWFGSVNVAAAFVALTVLLLPWPAWILAGSVLAWAQAFTAFAALALGALVRYPVWVLALGACWPLVALLTHKGESLGARWALWTIGVTDWWSTWVSVVFGWGFGGWATRFRHIYLRGETVPSTVASNDYVQWLHETGLVGVAALIVMVIRFGPTLWRSRRFAPACVALAVLAAGTFPFHHPVLQALGVTVLGLAWRDGARAA